MRYEIKLDLIPQRDITDIDLARILTKIVSKINKNKKKIMGVNSVSINEINEDFVCEQLKLEREMTREELFEYRNKVIDMINELEANSREE